MKANPANNDTLEEPRMTIPRRRLLAATAATALATPWIGGTARAQTKQLKISHQFPGGTVDSGDFRDQMCRRFAAALAKKTNGALTAEVYPGSSLVKTVAQYSAIRRGALDMTLYPLNYAGGEVSEYNIGFMPGVISSLDQAYAWKKAAIGKRLTALMAEKGAVPVIWLWQAGGSASRTHPILVPEDVKGLKVRGGSREMDLMLKGAGAAVVSMPSNELYAAMQTGTMDVAMTSSTSLMSFRLEEIAKNLTTGRSRSSTRCPKTSRRRSWMSAWKWRSSASKNPRKTTSPSPRSTKRPASRPSISTRRRSTNGRRWRATPAGRTTPRSRRAMPSS
jgi:TRAP-type C4-dicarboxylate transport system substrate-binding protein